VRFSKGFFVFLNIISSDTPRRGHQISLQMVVSHHVVLGFELRSFRRAVSALKG
jgi:hypothetical protein